MNLTHDAMLVSLRINSWSGRLYDRQASQQVAIHHDADTNAGRYNKRLLPKQAFAALATTMSNARTSHNSNTLPWDDQGGRLLTVANYERYTTALDTLIERVVRERARFIEDYDDYVDQARLDLGRLFRLEDYPGTEALQGKFAIRYRIVPVPELPDSITIKGRGGTDFRPGFAWLHEQGVRPGCCLYLTDMECDSYPEAEPPYPVVWVNWGAAGGPNREPWGERIDIGPA